MRTWRPTANEIQPAAKRAATHVIEALGTTVPGTSAADRLREARADPALADQAGPLAPPGSPAVVEIVYPQYGGLTGDRASVMTVARQTWIEDGEPHNRTVTADVRLRRTGDAWTVTALRPVKPLGGRTPALGRRARKLAALPGVDLPGAALADLAADVVDAMVVDALIELADNYGFSVSVFRAGHPERVFGTGRTSNHTLGRAVDIWAIDGRPIVEMEPDDPLLRGFLEAVRATGSDEIGGPVDPDGAGGVHFTDRVHRDHVHLGFEP